MPKPRILIFASYYLPGFKAGGAIRSLANLVEQLGEDYEFLVVSRDRDAGDVQPYKQAKEKSWASVGRAKVRYLSRNECSMQGLLRLIHDAQPNLLYFNSFLDPCFTIKPLILRRLGLLPDDINVIVAPRGEFAQGALALKAYKKKLFMFAAKWCGLYRHLVWQASSEFEVRDIKRWFADAENVSIAVDLTPKYLSNTRSKEHKNIGKLRVVCVARIARNKNIDGALRMLKEVHANIDFNLYGPNEDKLYWQECLEIVAELPSNINVVYHRQVPHEQVRLELPHYDLFFLPTQGENFCHAILEALISGLPLLISDRTPWRDLEQKGIGWDLPLDKPEDYSRTLEKCAQMEAIEFSQLSKNAMTYGLSVSGNNEAIHSTRALFSGALTL